MISILTAVQKFREAFNRFQYTPNFLRNLFVTISCQLFRRQFVRSESAVEEIAGQSSFSLAEENFASMLLNADHFSETRITMIRIVALQLQPKNRQFITARRNRVVRDQTACFCCCSL